MTPRKVAVLSLFIGLQRHHRWKITSQMRYVLTECHTTLTDSFIMFSSTRQTHFHTLIFTFPRNEHDTKSPARRRRKSLCPSPVLVEVNSVSRLWHVGKDIRMGQRATRQMHAR